MNAGRRRVRVNTSPGSRCKLQFSTVILVFAFACVGTWNARAASPAEPGNEANAPFLLAVVNPAAIRQNAPEELVIRITDASVTGFPEPSSGIRSILLLAEVLTATRTQTGLTEGQAIMIAWAQQVTGTEDPGSESDTGHEPGWAGPAIRDAPDPLPPGTITRAWLRQSGESSSGLIYVPATDQFTFEPIEE